MGEEEGDGGREGGGVSIRVGPARHATAMERARMMETPETAVGSGGRDEMNRDHAGDAGWSTAVDP